MKRQSTTETVTPVKLNARQLEAVHHTAGPLAVIAGPGTGKTRVITEKVVHLTRDQAVQAPRVLALTFTEKAAQEMHTRISKALADAGIRERPRVENFHAFCLDLVLEHYDLAGYDHRPELLAGPLYVQFVADNLDALKIEHYDLRGKVTRFAASLADFVGFCHDEGLINTDLTKAAEAWIAQLPESKREPKRKVVDFAHNVPHLLARQRQLGILSYGDLLTDAVGILTRHPDLLQQLQARYDHILVDEFQDNNRAQFELVNLLAATHARVTVVGDEDQSIYRFRGAATGLMTDFTTHWKASGHTVKEVRLDENYRSTDAILGVAHHLISQNKRRDTSTPIRRAEDSTATGPADVTFITLGNEADETHTIVHELLSELANPDRHPGDIAILARSLGHVTDLVSALRRHGIPVETVGGRGIFDNAVVREIHAWLQALDDPSVYEAELHRTLRFHHHPLSDTDIRRVSRAAYDDRRALLDVLHAVVEHNDPELSPEGRAQIRGFLAHFEELHTQLAPQACPDLVDVINRIVDAGGLRARLQPTTAQGRASLVAFGGLLDAAKRYQEHFPTPSLSGFVKHLELRVMLQLDDERAEPTDDPDAVKVMTVHQAKGREYPVVVVSGLMDRFPSDARAGPERQFLDHLTVGDLDEVDALTLEEERRLLYVAVTRAESRLILTATRTRNGKAPKKASPFYEELETTPGLLRREIPLGDAPTPAALETPRTLTREAAEARLHHIVSRFGGRIHTSANTRATVREAVNLLGGLLADSAQNAPAVEAELRALGLPTALQLPVPDTSPIPGYQGPLGLSASAANKFTACPRQFYYGHILRIPSPSGAAAGLGSAIHAALETHVKNLLASGERKLKSTQLDDLMKLVEQETEHFPFQAEAERTQVLVKLREVLGMYLAEEEASQHQVHSAEETIKLELEDGVTFTAKIDRIDTTPEGKLRITDYKFKDKLPSRPELLERNHQVTLYAWAASQHYAKPVESVELVGLKNPKELKNETRTDRVVFTLDHGKPRETITAEHIENTRAVLTNIITTTRAGGFPTTPGKSACQWCGYKKLCDDAWTEGRGEE